MDSTLDHIRMKTALLYQLGCEFVQGHSPQINPGRSFLPFIREGRNGPNSTSASSVSGRRWYHEMQNLT
jgi:hypothetical protein